MNNWEDHLTDDLAGVADQLRTQRHDPTDLRLDDLKRQAMAQATRASRRRQGRGFFVRSRVVTLLLVFGLLLASGGAGVIAAHQGDPDGDGSPPASAGHGQYCNSGSGNGYETPEYSGFDGPAPNHTDGDQTSTAPGGVAECDPGNSATHNTDSGRESDAGPSKFSPTRSR